MPRTTARAMFGRRHRRKRVRQNCTSPVPSVWYHCSRPFALYSRISPRIREFRLRQVLVIPKVLRVLEQVVRTVIGGRALLGRQPLQRGTSANSCGHGRGLPPIHGSWRSVTQVSVFRLLSALITSDAFHKYHLVDGGDGGQMFGVWLPASPPWTIACPACAVFVALTYALLCVKPKAASSRPSFH